MKFKLEINCDNAAFEPEGYASLDELARIMKRISEKLADGYHEGDVMDSNGNRVGTYKLA